MPINQELLLESGAQIKVARIDSFLPEVMPKREAERSAWRTLARELLAEPTAQFSYNSLGAPQIDNSHLKISVSHSRELVAVVISPAPCAIDVEELGRNFSTVAKRYISPDEQLLSTSEHLAAQLWSIKEALYKYAGRKELSLLGDIKVLSLGGENFTATISPHTTIICGTVKIIDDHVLAYII